MSKLLNTDGQRGFTLLEIVVGFAVLVLILGALFAALDLSSRGMQQAERKTSALLIAESRLAELGLDNELAEGVREGRLPDGGVWRIEIVPASVPEDAAPWRHRLLDVAVTVVPAGDSSAVVTLKTRRVRPVP